MIAASSVLALDFDGVLHPGGDAIHVASGKNLPMWQVEVALRTQGRFVWCEFLENALGDADVGIVIHSTWRRRFSDAELKQLLPESLRRRVLTLDGQIQSRMQGTADEYLHEVLEYVQPESLMVLDDRPEFFEQGLVRAWLNKHQGQMIFLDPQIGISDISARAAVSAWAGSSAEVDRLSRAASHAQH